METQFTLKDLREQAGLSCLDMANRLGVTVQSINRYENGRRRLPLEFIEPFARCLNESIEDVVLAAVATLKLSEALKLSSPD